MRKSGILAVAFACAVLLVPASAEAKKLTNPAAAQKLAQKKVKSATVTEVDTDYENGTLVYDVDMIKGKREYNLKYRASDGKLIEYEWDTNGIIKSYENRKNKTRSAIKKKAKKQVTKAKITSLSFRYDDGVAGYKVKLKKGNKQYKLVYHAKTGKLLEYEWKIVKKSSSSTKYIGAAKAKSIALKKVPGAKVIKVEYDKEDGVPVYEVELVKGNMEYELTIHAKSGKILEFDSESRDDD
ncbi:MAG: PepSY domain-containing protein [Lachnospiraceae bacterium]|nr:PepSY domain-containing protein [Lachnospiraceae bacterium]